MATSIGRWSPKRREKLSGLIVGYLVEENKWLDDYDQEFLKQLKTTEMAQVQYWEAFSFSCIINEIAKAEDPMFTPFKLLQFLNRYEGGLDAWGISDRLMNLKKPYLKLTKRQIALFVRRNIPKHMIEERKNENKILEFKINGYRKKIKDGIPKDWRGKDQEEIVLTNPWIPSLRNL